MRMLHRQIMPDAPDNSAAHLGLTSGDFASLIRATCYSLVRDLRKLSFIISRGPTLIE